MKSKSIIVKLAEDEDADRDVSDIDVISNGKVVGKLSSHIFVDSNDGGSYGQVFTDVPIIPSGLDRQKTATAELLLKDKSWNSYKDLDDVSKLIPSKILLSTLISLAKREQIKLDVNKLTGKTDKNRLKEINKAKFVPDIRYTESAKTLVDKLLNEDGSLEAHQAGMKAAKVESKPKIKESDTQYNELVRHAVYAMENLHNFLEESPMQYGLSEEDRNILVDAERVLTNFVDSYPSQRGD